MDIEFNEQRVRDVEIPLHKLEQRVAQLEGQIQNLSPEVFISTISHQINTSPKTYMPKIYNMITQYHPLLQQIQFERDSGSSTVASDQAKQSSGIDEDAKFMINSTRNELMLIKKQLEHSKLNEIEKLTTTVQNIKFEVDILKQAEQRTLKHTDLENIDKKICNLVRREEFKDLESDMVTKADFAEMQESLMYLRKDYNMFMKATDFTNRINIFQKEYNEKLNQRPTTKQIKNLVKNIDEKFDKLNKTVDGMSKEHNHFDNELKNFGQELNDLDVKLLARLTIKDGERIWKHFQRFSEYEDLKDLYAKTIPELAKFEGKLIDQQTQLDKFNQIVYRFDETLTQKLDKLSFNQFRKDVDDQYLKIYQLQDFEQRYYKHKTEFSMRFEEINRQCTIIQSELQKKIDSLATKMQNMMGGSILDQKGTGSMGGSVPHDILDRKIDQDQLREALEKKANIYQTESAFNQIKQLHGHLKAVLVFLKEYMNFQIDQEGDTANQRMCKKVALSKQLVIINKKAQQIEDLHYFPDQFKTIDTTQQRKNLIQNTERFLKTHSQFRIEKSKKSKITAELKKNKGTDAKEDSVSSLVVQEKQSKNNKLKPRRSITMNQITQIKKSQFFNSISKDEQKDNEDEDDSLVSSDWESDPMNETNTNTKETKDTKDTQADERLHTQNSNEEKGKKWQPSVCKFTTTFKNSNGDKAKAITINVLDDQVKKSPKDYDLNKKSSSDSPQNAHVAKYESNNKSRHKEMRDIVKSKFLKNDFNTNELLSPNRKNRNHKKINQSVNFQDQIDLIRKSHNNTTITDKLSPMNPKYMIQSPKKNLNMDCMILSPSSGTSQQKNRFDLSGLAHQQDNRKGTSGQNRYKADKDDVHSSTTGMYLPGIYK